MATSRLMPRHVDEGKSILSSIKRSLDYGKNPNKTRDGKLISSYECDPRTAALEFVLDKKQYTAITGREQPKDKDVLLYQIRQAFPKGEVSPEDANRIAYELAMRFTIRHFPFLHLINYNFDVKSNTAIIIYGNDKTQIKEKAFLRRTQKSLKIIMFYQYVSKKEHILGKESLHINDARKADKYWLCQQFLSIHRKNISNTINK